jgi:predicted acyltransferase (DUF342 family)
MKQGTRCKLAVGLFMVAVILGFAALPAYATALADNRDTPELRHAEYFAYIQGSNIIYAGALVAVDSTGVAVPAADTAGHNVVGRSEEEQDNTGSDYSATATIRVKRGTFRWVNGDAITDANVGSVAYVTDDQTVQAGASAQLIIAGVIVDVDTTGVWIDTSDVGGIGASTPSSLAVSGNGAIVGTLTVGGHGHINNHLNVESNLIVGISGTISNDLTVVDDADIGGDLDVTATLIVGEHAQINDHLNVESNLFVGIDATISNDLAVVADATIGGTATITGHAQVDNNFNVLSNFFAAGTASFSNAVRLTDLATHEAGPIPTGTNCPGLVGGAVSNAPLWFQVVNDADGEVYVFPAFQLDD